MAECSIIIVTFNGLQETTIPCLESVFRSAGSEDYEVIVVDNNSTDETPVYLKELAGREPRLRYILNTTNRGFAGGNNDGLQAASGSIIVLLNNDTQASDGWLTKLRVSLQTDRSIGLVGPVSNAVGNEQKIFVRGITPAEILDEGEQWSRHSDGDFFETARLGFFCVAFRRDLIETVGLLDEDYDLGFYEDDDYCLRVLKAGHRLVCREDVFIYHRGSASFDKAPKRTKELLKKNLRFLERKFGIVYTPAHPRDRQLALVESYLQLCEHAMKPVARRYKIENRLKIIDGLMPRGFLKRWRFERRFMRVLSQLQKL